MQNSVMLFILFIFDRKYPFVGKFCPKKKNYWFKLKFGTKSNSNMQSSIAMFTFSGFDWKYALGTTLVQKPKLSV